MRTSTRLFTALFLLLVVPAVGLSQSVDGVHRTVPLVNHPANFYASASGMIDVIGNTSSCPSNSGRAKGNAYRVDVDVELTEAEFWLGFTGTQMLTYYVFQSPVEFGTYNEIYRSSEAVAGVGADWYSTGPLGISLSAGQYYIIAVSWNGTATYCFDVGDEQATSFGAHVHGFATGLDPLPPSIESMVNDQAIYHQRLTTNKPTPVEQSSWGSTKAMYR